MFKQNQMGWNAFRTVFDETGSRLGFQTASGSDGSLSIFSLAHTVGFDGPEKNQSTIFSNIPPQLFIHLKICFINNKIKGTGSIVPITQIM